jgi:N-acetylglucosaminyldiphosphoundecaprenol N-acetyl-beta-D-mannosaminyltransferase
LRTAAPFAEVWLVPSTTRAELLGLPFDGVTMEAAIERCLAWCAGPRAPHTIITANSAILCMMRRDEELRRACLAGDLIVPDGMSVVWTSRMAGVPFPERVAGVDLMTRLLDAGAERRLRAFFLGAKPAVISRLVESCARRFPGLEVVGYRDGYFSADQHAAVVEEIRGAAPHLLFVGMPSPFKETWCERNRERLGVPVIMGVGGSFDVFAGYVRRAPRWMQSLGMEWSWRLLMEPRKMWRRYLTTNTEFLWLAGREIVSRRWQPLANHRSMP